MLRKRRNLSTVSIARARHEAARQSVDNAAGNELLPVRI